jgi:predicted alpha/beta hydrolase family esterase
MSFRAISYCKNSRPVWKAVFCTTVLAAFMLLSGCAVSTTERTSALQSEGVARGFFPVRYGTTPPIVGMLRANSVAAAPDILWVVIEGDGRAWLSMREPSRDPTPIDAVGWRLAKDLSGNAVLYLARPCQFLSSAELQICSVSDWTDARFSEKWVARMNAAIDEAKNTTHARRVALAGYSGGGVLAALIAARRTDVRELVTVAAPLDHAAWTALHKVTPLAASLSVLPVKKKLFRLPQVHLAGAEDEVVPSDLLWNFLRDYPADAPVELLVLPGIDHRMRTEIDLGKIRVPGISAK